MFSSPTWILGFFSSMTLIAAFGLVPSASVRACMRSVTAPGAAGAGWAATGAVVAAAAGLVAAAAGAVVAPAAGAGAAAAGLVGSAAAGLGTSVGLAGGTVGTT